MSTRVTGPRDHLRLPFAQQTLPHAQLDGAGSNPLGREPMTALDYRLFDADTHYYEPDDCFTRHIEAQFKDRTVWIDRRGDAPGRMYVGRERCHFFSVGAGDSVGPPGIMKAFLRGDSDAGGSPEPERDQRARGAGVRRSRAPGWRRWMSRASKPA